MEQEGDDEAVDAHFRKTFITENKATKEEEAWTLHEMAIPQGQPAKLIRIPDPNNKVFRASEVADRLKFIQPIPVIILAGAMENREGKVLAGIARAAFNTTSLVMDSGLISGIERACIRKKVQLIGVAPEAQISYPKISRKKTNELANGHSHFFLIGKEDKSVKFAWGDESSVKYELAKRFA